MRQIRYVIYLIVICSFIVVLCSKAMAIATAHGIVSPAQVEYLDGCENSDLMTIKIDFAVDEESFYSTISDKWSEIQKGLSLIGVDPNSAKSYDDKTQCTKNDSSKSISCTIEVGDLFDGENGPLGEYAEVTGILEFVITISGNKDLPWPYSADSYIAYIKSDIGLIDAVFNSYVDDCNEVVEELQPDPNQGQVNTSTNNDSNVSFCTSLAASDCDADGDGIFGAEDECPISPEVYLSDGTPFDGEADGCADGIKSQGGAGFQPFQASAGCSLIIR